MNRRTDRPFRVAHVCTVDLSLRFLLLPQLRRLKEEGYDVTAISAPGPWVADVEAEGIRHVGWSNATRAWDPKADLAAFLELIGILRRERFDLVHTHMVKPGLMGRVAARLARTHRVVNTVHGFYATPDDPFPKRAAILAMEAVAARFSDLELYQSEEDLAWARRVGVVGARKSALLGNGCDLSRFEPSAATPARQAELRAELGIDADSVVVGTVGRLVAEKGYREFFEAARRIRKSRPEVRFVAVGNIEPDKWDAIGDGEIERARPDVVFTGWREDVRDLMAIMDVFVLASWREGLPRSAVEAAAMGKPLVLTDIRGCREVARDGVEGLLVPTRQPEALTAAINRLVADPSLRERMGEAARARAVDRFDEARVLETITKRYGRLLPRVARAGAEGDVRVRTGRLADAPALASLHQEIPYAFMERLGPGFLRRFYAALLTDQNAVVLVAENGQGPVGFVSAVSSSKAFNRRFYLRYGIGAMVSAAPRLLRPAVLRGAIETVRYTAANGDLPDAELISIAVLPDWRARGIGKTLMEGVILALAERGVGQMRVMVRAENDRANRFYSAMGFREADTIDVHGGKASRVWVTSCRS